MPYIDYLLRQKNPAGVETIKIGIWTNVLSIHDHLEQSGKFGWIDIFLPMRMLYISIKSPVTFQSRCRFNIFRRSIYLDPEWAIYRRSCCTFSRILIKFKLSIAGLHAWTQYSTCGLTYVLCSIIACNLFRSCRCWATVALEFLPTREHGYLRSGHVSDVTEATSRVEVLTTSLSLHFTMGPLKCVLLNSFLLRGRELEARLAIGVL